MLQPLPLIWQSLSSSWPWPIRPGGSAHHWARRLTALGIEVKLLPAQYVRAYVRRNKTDVADAAALLEAAICACCSPTAPGRWRSPMGPGRTGSQQSQQGHLRAGQQAGPHLLRHVARQGSVRRKTAAAQEDASPGLRDA